jgi:hypothetical protein
VVLQRNAPAVRLTVVAFLLGLLVPLVVPVLAGAHGLRGSSRRSERPHRSTHSLRTAPVRTLLRDAAFGTARNGGRERDLRLPAGYRPAGRIDGSTTATTPTSSTAPTTIHPGLILDQARIDAIRARIATGTEPEASAWAHFRDGWARMALAATPDVFPGPYRGVEDFWHVFDSLSNDGARSRDLGLAYVISGDVAYAQKCREFLLAWALGNTPTTQQDFNGNDVGYHQAFGAFSFAYAYDLTYNAGVYSAADRGAIEGYFSRFADAIQTANDKIAGDWFIDHPEVMYGYKWDGTKQYRRRDTYVGGDAAALGQTARLALAQVSGRTDVVRNILDDQSNVLGLESMLASALTPMNQGDGVPGHPVPAPHVYVYLGYTAGRGGMMDYMTYNTRAYSVLVGMAENMGWDVQKTAAARSKLHASWSWLARFFGPEAEPNFNPVDVVELDANLPRFWLPFQEFGDARFQQVALSGDWAAYYEPQLLGPVSLTHGTPI